MPLTPAQKKPHTKTDILEQHESKEWRQPDKDRQRVFEIVADLPQAHRDVLLLRFADQMTLEEIAQKLQLPKGTVKSRLHNALQKLRQTPDFIWLLSLLQLADF